MVRDTPLSNDTYAAAELRCGSPAWNINGVSLSLDGPTAAKIFNGAITRWNHPAIQAVNSGVTLPAEPIHVVFRGDASGTTDNFQQYLDAASNGAWGKGAGKTFNGGVSEGAKGNDGTSAGPAPVPISTDSVGEVGDCLLEYPDPPVGTAVKEFLQNALWRWPKWLRRQQIDPRSGRVQVEVVDCRQRDCVI